MNHVFAMQNEDAEFAAIARFTISSLKNSVKKEYKKIHDLTKSYKIDTYIVDRNALIDQEYSGKVELVLALDSFLALEHQSIDAMLQKKVFQDASIEELHNFWYVEIPLVSKGLLSYFRKQSIKLTDVKESWIHHLKCGLGHLQIEKCKILIQDQAFGFQELEAMQRWIIDDFAWQAIVHLFIEVKEIKKFFEIQTFHEDCNQVKMMKELLKAAGAGYLDRLVKENDLEALKNIEQQFDGQKKILMSCFKKNDLKSAVDPLRTMMTNMLKAPEGDSCEVQGEGFQGRIQGLSDVDLQALAEKWIKVNDFKNFISNFNFQIPSGFGGYNVRSLCNLATPDQKTGKVQSVEVAKIMQLMGQALIKELLLAAGEEISLENIKKINLMYEKLLSLEQFLIPGQKDGLQGINDFYQSERRKMLLVQKLQRIDRELEICGDIRSEYDRLEKDGYPVRDLQEQLAEHQEKFKRLHVAMRDQLKVVGPCLEENYTPLRQQYDEALKAFQVWGDEADASERAFRLARKTEEKKARKVQEEEAIQREIEDLVFEGKDFFNVHKEDFDPIPVQMMKDFFNVSSNRYIEYLAANKDIDALRSLQDRFGEQKRLLEDFLAINDLPIAVHTLHAMMAKMVALPAGEQSVMQVAKNPTYTYTLFFNQYNPEIIRSDEQLQNIARRWIMVEDFEKFISAKNIQMGQASLLSGLIASPLVCSLCDLATPDKKTGKVQSVEVAKIMQFMGQALIRELLLVAAEEMSLENIEKITLIHEKLLLLKQFLIPGQKNILDNIAHYYQHVRYKMLLQNQLKAIKKLIKEFSGLKKKYEEQKEENVQVNEALKPIKKVLTKRIHELYQLKVSLQRFFVNHKDLFKEEEYDGFFVRYEKQVKASEVLKKAIDDFELFRQNEKILQELETKVRAAVYIKIASYQKRLKNLIPEQQERLRIINEKRKEQEQFHALQKEKKRKDDDAKELQWHDRNIFDNVGGADDLDLDGFFERVLEDAPVVPAVVPLGAPAPVVGPAASSSFKPTLWHGFATLSGVAFLYKCYRVHRQYQKLEKKARAEEQKVSGKDLWLAALEKEGLSIEKIKAMPKRMQQVLVAKMPQDVFKPIKNKASSWSSALMKRWHRAVKKYHEADLSESTK